MSVLTAAVQINPSSFLHSTSYPLEISVWGEGLQAKRFSFVTDRGLRACAGSASKFSGRVLVEVRRGCWRTRLCDCQHTRGWGHAVVATLDSVGAALLFLAKLAISIFE